MPGPGRTSGLFKAAGAGGVAAKLRGFEAHAMVAVRY